MAQRFSLGPLAGLRVGRFGKGLNTASILYRLGETVIDTGPPNQWAPVRMFLKERSVGRVLLTHHHEDHSGNAARIQGESGARVFAHAFGVAPLAEGFPLCPYQRLLFGRPQPVCAESLPAAVELEDGGRLLPLHTPGHAPDMVCYLAPERGWLFTGDGFVSTKPRYLRRDEELGAQLDSLRLLLAREFDTVLCGHRGIVPDGREALRQKLSYLEDLGERARVLQGKGRSVRQITRELLGREDLPSFVTLRQFTKRNLIEACLACR